MFAPPRSVPALLGCLALLALPAGRAETPPPDPITDAWSKATLYLFGEAYQDFAEHETREGRLGRAALLLLQQPKTDSNLVSAASRLQALIEEGPADDETSIAARYLLARIAHIHRTPINVPLATEHYRKLLAEHPDHFLADQALIKLALIEIYEVGLAPAELLARIDRYGDLADGLARPGSRRDLHLVLATAAANLRLDDERTLRHYLAADQAGVERPVLRANVTVAVGELARRLGRHDLAREYFERYLAEFQRDYRRALVRDKLASLPALATTQETRR